MKAAINANAAMHPLKMNTVRQLLRSAITPDADEPNKLPSMAPASRRLIATCRPLIGTTWATSASEIGKMPPATMPETMRVSMSIGRFQANAAAKVAIVTTTRQANMVRVLPSTSPMAPSTGCISAYGSANAVASNATVSAGSDRSAAICGMIGSTARKNRLLENTASHTVTRMRCGESVGGGGAAGDGGVLMPWRACRRPSTCAAGSPSRAAAPCWVRRTGHDQDPDGFR